MTHHVLRKQSQPRGHFQGTSVPSCFPGCTVPKGWLRLVGQLCPLHSVGGAMASPSLTQGQPQASLQPVPGSTFKGLSAFHLPALYSYLLSHVLSLLFFCVMLTRKVCTETFQFIAALSFPVLSWTPPAARTAPIEQDACPRASPPTRVTQALMGKPEAPPWHGGAGPVGDLPPG